MGMFEIDRFIKRVHERVERDHANDKPVQQIILDMEGVTSLEFTGIEELVMRLREIDDIPIKMIDCDQAILNAMDQCDPGRRIEREMGDED